MDEESDPADPASWNTVLLNFDQMYLASGEETAYVRFPNDSGDEDMMDLDADIANDDCFVHGVFIVQEGAHAPGDPGLLRVLPGHRRPGYPPPSVWAHRV